ncbi:hypothetical protein JX266_004270 [Neoarthrinium moseri]|uniref:uncharacterized protein n=1 Tax=Neoarthrinium moseri TaxID=1658444 RepID=UPI001FDBB22A|nr:uncharacterized protein JN550_004090 [Neoarthrinium moseri]KAI1850412.1 hypothetical protein JX266_004270 [Neoarthrinium moseri]KAI1872371.1 hypothetical protein JN550_004090 [Neoarthrinium moseri]
MASFHSEAESDAAWSGDEDSSVIRCLSNRGPQSASTEGSVDEATQALPDYARAHYEHIARYQRGGFHPVHIGDYLDSKERYRVLHKLGFGSSSTIWLCDDVVRRRFRAVKVVSADKSKLKDHNNERILSLVKACKGKGLSNSIVVPRDKFWITGPNGQHLCLVMPVLGPNLLDGLEGAGLDTPGYLTYLCFKLSVTLSCLHENGIIHGDIRPQKLMMVLRGDCMDEAWRKDSLHDLIEKPSIWKLSSSSQSSSNRAPKYLVKKINLCSLEKRFRSGTVAIADFSRSPQNGLRIGVTNAFPAAYSAPEVRLNHNIPDFSSDIWSLAACIYLIRTGRELMPQMDSISAFIAWTSWNFDLRKRYTTGLRGWKRHPPAIGELCQ